MSIVFLDQDRSHRWWCPYPRSGICRCFEHRPATEAELAALVKTFPEGCARGWFGEEARKLALDKDRRRA